MVNTEITVYAYLMLKRYTQALEDVNKSIAMLPENSYSYRNRALIMLETKQFADACLDLNKAKNTGFEKLYGNEVNELLKLHCK